MPEIYIETLKPGLQYFADLYTIYFFITLYIINKYEMSLKVEKIIYLFIHVS